MDQGLLLWNHIKGRRAGYVATVRDYCVPNFMWIVQIYRKIFVVNTYNRYIGEWLFNFVFAQVELRSSISSPALAPKSLMQKSSFHNQTWLSLWRFSKLSCFSQWWSEFSFSGTVRYRWLKCIDVFLRMLHFSWLKWNLRCLVSKTYIWLRYTTFGPWPKF